ncbi:MAG: response regulator [Alphaproteobacteria bacterium]|nr:response regulator [Alphaproteobacteria bacterium]MBF0130681.1 response regulator [Alphaproteobacteria bacterium]
MSGALANVKIVLIEASLDMRNMMVKILRDQGANRLEPFNNVVPALTFLKESSVDLILCEMEQSPLDGTAFAQALRSGKAGPNTQTPLLLTAADNDMARIKEAIAAGASNILLRPYSAADLVKRVRKLANR